MRHLLWQGAKTVGSKALVTGRNIISDMANPDAKIRDVVRRNVTESAHRVLNKLSDRGRKRKRVAAKIGGGRAKRVKKQPKAKKKRGANGVKKKKKIIKRDI